jgi:hypothetical protein
VATVYHRYLRRGEQPEPEPRREDEDVLKAKKAAADLQFVEEKKLQVIARRRETEIRNAQRKRELIPRELVVKQSAFLVIATRQRLLAIAAQRARDLLNVSDEREMARRLDAIVRDALSEIAQMPLRVSDEHWLEKLDENEATSVKRLVALRDRPVPGGRFVAAAAAPPAPLPPGQANRSCRSLRRSPRGTRACPGQRARCARPGACRRCSVKTVRAAARLRAGDKGLQTFGHIRCARKRQGVAARRGELFAFRDAFALC